MRVVQKCANAHYVRLEKARAKLGHVEAGGVSF
jgi:hypothetical protein